MGEEEFPPILLYAAGFGKRLRPITEKIPKPLVKLQGKPLIEWNLELISRSGFRKVFVNLHYLGKLIADQLGDGRRWNLSIDYLLEPKILDTGGTLLGFNQLWKKEELITFNSDVVIDPKFDLARFYIAHKKNSPIVSMLVRKDLNARLYGSLGLDVEQRIVNFLGENFVENRQVSREVMFCGVQCLSKKILDYVPREEKVFSSTRDIYPAALRAGEVFRGILWNGYWTDAGNMENLARAQVNFKRV